MNDSDKLDRILIGQGRLETKFEALENTVNKHEHQSNARLESIETWRQGNGVVGVDKKIDRLEQTDKRKAKHFFVFYSAIVGGGIALGFAALKLFLFGGL